MYIRLTLLEKIIFMKQETKKTWVSPELKNISLDKTNTGTTSSPGKEGIHSGSDTYSS